MDSEGGSADRITACGFKSTQAAKRWKPQKDDGVLRTVRRGPIGPGVQDFHSALKQPFEFAGFNLRGRPFLGTPSRKFDSIQSCFDNFVNSHGRWFSGDNGSTTS